MPPFFLFLLLDPLEVLAARTLAPGVALVATLAWLTRELVPYFLAYRACRTLPARQARLYALTVQATRPRPRPPLVVRGRSRKSRTAVEVEHEGQL